MLTTELMLGVSTENLYISELFLGNGGNVKSIGLIVNFFCDLSKAKMF